MGEVLRPWENAGLGNDLEEATLACIRDLETEDALSSKKLLRLLDANGEACEALLERVAPRQAELRQLFDIARRELRPAWVASCAGLPAALVRKLAPGSPVQRGSEDEPGLLSDLLQSFGIRSAASTPEEDNDAWSGFDWPVLFPEDAAHSNCNDASDALRVDVDAALELMAHGPRRVLRDATVLLGEFEAWRKLFEELRASGSLLVQNIGDAITAKAPLESSGMIVNFKEALAWRRDSQGLVLRGDLLCGHLLDTLQQRRTLIKERQRFQSATRTLIDGMDSRAAARASSLLWLGGLRRGRKGAIPDVADTFARNLKVADDLSARLTKCAGAVMRAEDRRRVVRRVVRRLSGLKTNLATSSDRLMLTSGIEKAAKHMGSGDESTSSGAHGTADVTWHLTEALNEDPEAVEFALEDLMQTIDSVARLLRSCPIASRGFAGGARSEEAEALRNWSLDVLLGSVAAAAEDSDASSCDVVEDTDA